MCAFIIYSYYKASLDSSVYTPISFMDNRAMTDKWALTWRVLACVTVSASDKNGHGCARKFYTVNILNLKKYILVTKK